MHCHTAELDVFKPSQRFSMCISTPHLQILQIANSNASLQYGRYIKAVGFTSVLANAGGLTCLALLVSIEKCSLLPGCSPTSSTASVVLSELARSRLRLRREPVTTDNQK